MVNKNYNLYMLIYRFKKGFTLAEVLITLGIVGVVAAITIPTISKNIQNAVLKNQFKKFYSTFSQAVFGIQTMSGRPVKCHYWTTQGNPYTNNCTFTCAVKNEFGVCISQLICAETGLPIPSDYNGPMSECEKFQEELFINTLKTVKICKDHAYEQGCLPKDFRGADIVNSEINPDVEYDPNGNFSDNNVKNNYPVSVLSDGIYIIAYPREIPIYAVDINGFKGPNKWGYDIFSFILRGNLNRGISDIIGSNYAIEEGGKTFEQMYNESFK